jgi:hypothetical protein
MTGALREDQRIFMIVYSWIILRIRNVSEEIVEKIKTFILCWIFFLIRFFLLRLFWVFWCPLDSNLNKHYNINQKNEDT